jgi:hypothetical protein
MTLLPRWLICSNLPTHPMTDHYAALGVAQPNTLGGYIKFCLHGISLALFGYRCCRQCWHRTRIAGMAFCDHPQGIFACGPLPGPAFIAPNHFLQRPSLLERLRHPRTWRDKRFALMKLMPAPEQQTGLNVRGLAAQLAHQQQQMQNRLTPPLPPASGLTQTPGGTPLVPSTRP